MGRGNICPDGKYEGVVYVDYDNVLCYTKKDDSEQRLLKDISYEEMPESSMEKSILITFKGEIAMDNTTPVIDTKKNAAKFYKVVETYIKRDGINDLMDWLGSTDFFEAPASTRFHGSYEGGLCQHSLNVGKWLNKLAEGLYPGQYTKETLTLVALFHDVCKANCYKTSTRNVKNEQTGQWEKVPFFAWEEVLPFGGHGSKSMHLVEKFVKLTDEEASAINCHGLHCFVGILLYRESV